MSRLKGIVVRFLVDLAKTITPEQVQEVPDVQCSATAWRLAVSEAAEPA